MGVIQRDERKMETNLKRKIPPFCVSNLGFQRWSCSSLENFLCRGAPNTTTRKNASEEEEEEEKKWCDSF